MTYMLRKFRRELFHMKFRAVLVILSIALAIGMYGGLLLVKDNAFASRDDVFDQINYEDGRILLYNLVSESRIRDLLLQINGIKSLDVRLSIDVSIMVGDNHFPSIMHNIHSEKRPAINDIIVKEGKFSSINSGEIIIENRFAEARNMSVGDPITLIYGNFKYETKVGCIAFSPEHMYSMNPITSLPEKGVFAPIWFSIEYLETKLGIPNLINEILLTVDELNNLDLVMEDIISILQENSIVSLGIKGTEEMDYVMMKEDVGTLDKFAVAIGLVILLVAIFIIYDSIIKIITSQKTLIGILRALGASTSKLLIHYISFGMVLTIIGILVGIPLGNLITHLSTSIFVEAIGFELTTNVFRFESFIPSILIALSVAFIASFLGTMRIININPVEAINDQKIKQFNKGYKIERFFDKLAKNKYSTKIPVRQVFRRKKRSFMTALTISLAALIILTSFGFLDSFFHQMDYFYEENSLADMEISLVDPIPIQNINQQINTIKDVDYYEGLIRQQIYIYGKENNETSVIYAYKSDTTLRHYTFKEGSLKPGEIAIGQILARKLGVNIGDEIQLLTRGLSSFDTNKISYVVSGITEEFFDNFVFINLKTLQTDFGYGDRVNAISISVKENPDTVEKALYETNLPIATVIDLEQSKTSFRALMEAVIGFAYFVIVLGIFVLIIFSLNVIVLDVMDRDREFINIRVNGGSNTIIAKIISLQILLLSLLVLIIDTFISPSFTKFITDQTMRNMAHIEFYMNPISYGFSLIAFTVGISFGLLSAIHNVTTANIVDIMRLRFKN